MMKTLVILCAIAIAASASADVLLGWDFNGLTGGTAALDASATWTTADGNGPGYNDDGLQLASVTTTVTGRSTQDDFYRISGFDLQNTAPADIPASHSRYITWTVDPKDKHLITLDPTDSIVWRDIRIYDLEGEPDTIVVRSSLDGYSANLMVHPGGGDAITVDVGSGFQDLSDAVTFRLYVCDPDGASGGQLALREDSKGPDIAAAPLEHLDMVVNGSILEIPEPASVSLLALCAAFLLKRRG